MGTAQKIAKIKMLLNRMGWSLTDLAGAIIDYEDDLDDINLASGRCAKALGEALKKQFQRATLPEEKLDHYLKAITDNVAYEGLRLDLIRPIYVPHRGIDEELALQLTQLSSELDVFDEDKKNR